MCFMCSVAYGVAGVSVLLGNSGAPLALATATQVKTISSQVQSLQDLPSVLGSMKVPNLEEPAWLKDQNAAEAAAKAAKSVPVVKVVTYDVTSKGAITANMAEFRSQANATLNDGRGWARLGVSFQEVASGGMFTLVMSEASQMPTFSSGCGTDYSCRAGRYVVINQDRWLGATPSWNNAGGSLRDYRHMVINHETGHWLGHEHEFCGGPGQPAPVMQQQSIDLQGCTFNAWPTASEMWSTQLGITKV
ncbi:MAG: rane protein [Candidatus Saccharibacteria bacterium]|nr:rane protein [Candidatus Saccharibacteria bacterium]